jgi:hypothetical protein
VDLELHCHANTLAPFYFATTTQVGNGTNTLFWFDRWLYGCFIGDLAPAVVDCVQHWIRNKPTVAQAMDGDAWMGDIWDGLSMAGFMEVLHIGDCLCKVLLSQEED